jgi:hypothetical protein
MVLAIIRVNKLVVQVAQVVEAVQIKPMLAVQAIRQAHHRAKVVTVETLMVAVLTTAAVAVEVQAQQALLELGGLVVLVEQVLLLQLLVLL